MRGDSLLGRLCFRPFSALNLDLPQNQKVLKKTQIINWLSKTCLTSVFLLPCIKKNVGE